MGQDKVSAVQNGRSGSRKKDCRICFFRLLYVGISEFVARIEIALAPFARLHSRVHGLNKCHTHRCGNTSCSAPKSADKQQKGSISSTGHTAPTKVDKHMCKWCVHLWIWVDFTTPMGTPFRTQKAHLAPQGGHLRLEECILKGTFQVLLFLARIVHLSTS